MMPAVRQILTHPLAALILRLYLSGLFIYAGMVKINYTASICPARG